MINLAIQAKKSWRKRDVPHAGGAGVIEPEDIVLLRSWRGSSVDSSVDSVDGAESAKKSRATEVEFEAGCAAFTVG